ncbi:single-stranded-DNA-specific exonuclease RecJ [Christiangramia sediminis]|uniref:Single-stranded-DNA-specific exonuclease RecJ n=1 Tax=Christiangramia sediminis TaxID=2881336 RepID=A0A9X1LKE1_9FLAO|nr:single-stranded-DNA-specific exonuclease RecJ [Christiangramia sediminis]MCB7481952.1 single-stranded-DNA-specific exonuclease RecJ [Christiangramia sediminis]
MRWTLKPKPDPITTTALADKLGIGIPVAKLLVQRGINSFEEAKKFFRPELKDLHDPFLMKDMEKAVERIESAIENEENIMVYGDYDVDGTTSVALMSSFLKFRYPNVTTYIPDRYEEGYGVSYQGIDYAEDNDIHLIIALDCGIKAIDKVAYAKKKGIDFVICDHHRPGSEIPDAIAVLDPKREDCNYPYDELCGCGVGFKLIQAITQKNNEPEETLLPYLDLVATAIGADIVPITGENRILAYHGLYVINVAPRKGIRSILGDRKNVSITDVVFIVAPRINAAGRMKHGLHAVNLLTEEDEAISKKYAEEIEAYNTDRRSADKTITEEAKQQIIKSKEEERLTSVVYQENWHKGVIGIVASRLTETWYRPTLVFTKSGERLAASARSVKGFDVYEALEACKDHIEQFGGHKYAAGLTLLESEYLNFKQKFEEVVSETIDRALLTPEISIDAELSLKDITSKFYRILKQFAPYGPGNMSPVFISRGLTDTGYGKCVGEDKTHLKSQVRQEENGRVFDMIGFNLGDKLDIIKEGKKFDAVYSLDENTWNGNTKIQLKLKDIRESV